MDRRVFEPPSAGTAHRRNAIGMSIVVLLAGSLALIILKGGLTWTHREGKIGLLILLVVAYLGIRLRLTAWRKPPYTERALRPPRRRSRFPSDRSE